MDSIFCMVYGGSDNIYQVYQPEEGTFFHTLYNTEVGQEYEYEEIEGINGPSRVYVLRDIDEVHLHSYTEYLLGNTDFEWNEEVSQFFDLMGHNNILGLSNEFWRIKLVHDRICTLGLKTLFPIRWNDITYFDPRNIRYAIRTTLEQDIDELYSKLVGSTCLLQYEDELYTTYPGYYSLTTGHNWYEPNKHSKEYIKTLVDEHVNCRFKIILPGMDNITINMDEVYYILDEIVDEFYIMYRKHIPVEKHVLLDIGHEIDPFNENELRVIASNISDLVTVPYLYGLIDRDDGEKLRALLHSGRYGQEIIRWLVEYPLKYRGITSYERYPTDLTTNLLLQAKFGFSFMAYSNIQDDEFKGWNISSIVVQQ